MSGGVNMLIIGLSLLTTSLAVATRRDKSILYARSNIFVLVSSVIVNFSELTYGFQDLGIYLFHGFFHNTVITQIFHIVMLTITIVILQINSNYPRKIWISDSSFFSLYKIIRYKFICNKKELINKTAEQFRIMEYTLIVTFIVTGGMLLICCSDLMSLFLSIELQSYGLYILCSSYRDSEKATWAGLTYFLLGGLSSCFILLSAGLFYANLGNTNFNGLYMVKDIFNINNLIVENVNEQWYVSSYIEFGLITLCIGFLFKIAAAPFHFWSPDVYDAIPTIVTIFVAIFAKISILVVILYVVYYSKNTQLDVQANDSLIKLSLSNILLLSSIFSLIIGSILGLIQYRIKRLYAYSTISHVGFILLALCANSTECIESFLFYIIQYSFSNLNAFLVLIAIGYSLFLYQERKFNADDNDYLYNYNISDRNDSPIQKIEQIKGYYGINPLLCISLGLTIFSFVGIPPLIGFFAKQMVLISALENGFVVLTITGIVSSVIGAYYYLAVVKQMFFSKTNYGLDKKTKNIIFDINITKNNSEKLSTESVTVRNVGVSSYLSITIGILSIVMVFFIINPQELLGIANILALSLYVN